MELITHFELAAMPLAELRALRGRAYARLLRSDAETPARASALASLENIDREIGLRVGPMR